MVTWKRRWLSVFLMCFPLRTVTLLVRPRSSRFNSLSSLVMLCVSLKILNLLLKCDCGISILQSAIGWVFKTLAPFQHIHIFFPFNFWIWRSISPRRNYSIALKYNCIFVAPLRSFLGVPIMQLNGFKHFTLERCKKSVSIRLDILSKWN